MAFALLISVFVIATCGLVYELVAGALASYLLGDSVTQFSTVIGAYLFSMGIGSWLSKYITRNVATVFIEVEYLIGLVGGFSAVILFMLFDHVGSFRVLLYFLVGLTGILVGLEIPLVMRLIKNHFAFKDLISRVLTFDYIGALIASLLFPLVLVPHLGLMRSALLFGMLNVVVGIWAIRFFRHEMPWPRTLLVSGIGLLAVLGAGFAEADNLLKFAESGLYYDRVIYAKSTPYQRLVLTKGTDDLRLFINGNLQFSSRDEYRYHEALVHVGLASLQNPRRVLILGGGDGLALREVLRYPSVDSVTLVDLDPAMTKLFSSNALLKALNEESLLSPKVHIINADAFVWLKENHDLFDFVVVDFPDPGNFSVGKLYTHSFYSLLSRAIDDRGIIAVQSTSPYYAKKSFWCIDATLRAAGLHTTPYHAHVPSFGEWGFVLASKSGFKQALAYPSGLRFINAETVSTLMNFPGDMKAPEVEINRLNNQILVRYFEDEWSRYIQ